MQFLRFMIINTLASIPKVIIFLLIGYYFGSAYVAINGYMERVGIILTLILLIGVLIYFLYFRKKK
jgi:membrane protein DedA with SNARE-associated domain